MFQSKDRVMEWIEKQEQLCLQETHFRLKDTHKLKVKGWEKLLHTNKVKKKKKAGVAILISSKRLKKRQEKDGYITTKGSIQQAVITHVNIYASNIGVPNYIKQM